MSKIVSAGVTFAAAVAKWMTLAGALCLDYMADYHEKRPLEAFPHPAAASP